MDCKIGIILPRSDMFPTLTLDFLNSLKLALKKLGEEDFIPKFIIESVGNATGVPLLRNTEKLVLQEIVDLAISFFSIFKLKEMVSIFNAFKKTLIHMVLGESVLKEEHTSPFVNNDARYLIGLKRCEVGLTISSCIKKNGKIPAKIGDFANSLVLETPRGELTFSTYYESQVTTDKIIQVLFVDGQYKNSGLINIGNSNPDELYKKFQDQPYSGCQNPNIIT